MVNYSASTLKARNLHKLIPALADEWHPTKNGNLTSKDVTPGMNIKVWWKCKNGHEWEALLNNRSRGRGCPYCAGKIPSKENCLRKSNPGLSKEWHPTKNNKLTPGDITYGSTKKVWWQCKKGHEWQATVANRSNGTGCPKCKSKTSYLELRLYSELKCLFDKVEHRKIIDGYECDIFIPKINFVLENDGAYWHKDKVQWDRKKNDALKKKGIYLLRVRDKGLPKIGDEDISFGKKDADFSLMSQIIQVIKSKAKLTKKQINNLENYLQEKKLINQIEFVDLLDYLPGPLPGYSLKDKKPQLAKEWHTVRNGKLTPNDVAPNAGVKVWWQCRKGHEWQTTVDKRSIGTGCPYCLNQLVVEENSLAIKNPKVASEWHPFKNGEMSAKHVAPNSGKKAWWLCSEGHEWEARVADRNSGYNCPYCGSQKIHWDNSLQKKNPKLAKEWHPTKNGKLTPKDVMLKSNKVVWWQCQKGHEWETRICNRSKNLGCPLCESLAVKYPRIAKEWHSTKNGSLSPYDLRSKSGKKVWWRCKKGHEWQATPAHRSNGTGCPYCVGKMVDCTNSLAAQNPKLAQEWHPTKNGKLTAKDVVLNSNTRVWWRCKKGHEWYVSINNRSSNKTGCPYCAGQKVSKDNCLATLNPNLSKEWHPMKNQGISPKDITAGSKKKVWWRCKKGHEWEALVKDRNRGRGCPYCAGKRK